MPRQCTPGWWLRRGIHPGRIQQGALVLANALPYMPAGVHLAVVDPGVGSGRRPLALRDAEGRFYVGPDNGLLLPAADRFGGAVEAHELANPAYALVRLELPEPEVGRSRIRATVLSVDRFGNIALNLRREHLEQASIVPGTRVELDVSGNHYYAVAARTFADARRGELILYEDSYRNVAIAVASGSAASVLGVAEGIELLITVDAI